MIMIEMDHWPEIVGCNIRPTIESDSTSCQSAARLSKKMRFKPLLANFRLCAVTGSNLSVGRGKQ